MAACMHTCDIQRFCEGSAKFSISMPAIILVRTFIFGSSFPSSKLACPPTSDASGFAAKLR
eukprot:6736640-Karenia_brevis.AAC.1